MQLDYAHCLGEKTCCRLPTFVRNSMLTLKKKKRICKKTSKKCKKAGGKCQSNTKECKSTVQKEDLCNGASCTCCLKECKQKKKCKKAGGVCKLNDQCCGRGQISRPLCKRGCQCCIDNFVCVTDIKQNYTCGIANLEINTTTTPLTNIKVIEGKPVEPPHKYPWMVVIEPEGYLCGGSIISNHYVITAAHCLLEENCPISPDKVVVKVGRYNVNHKEGIPGFTRTIKAAKCIIHPEHNETSHENDIALIMLSEHLDLIAHKDIGAICLPADDTNMYSGYNGTVSGWGTTSTVCLVPSDILMEVSLPILENCTSYPEKEANITENMLCAGNFNDIKDSCAGDSGGPLFIEENNGKNTLVGIVSFGPVGEHYCSGIGVYTRVSKYLDWIKYTLNSHNC
ncbi:unnamed protein product [Meganyctiphanes norvegica]|uniref:Peptidase S1 domain-containing protein n=1 Tax=Meganyctiphanes norvegica TaxID=48144 RepID=A0AAV2PUG4_MEGNR